MYFGISEPSSGLYIRGNIIVAIVEVVQNLSDCSVTTLVTSSNEVVVEGVTWTHGCNDTTDGHLSLPSRISKLRKDTIEYKEI
jgi:hypothetical protein